MKKIYIFLVIIFLILLIILSLNFQEKERPKEKNTKEAGKMAIEIEKLKNITLTTVYDNYLTNQKLKTGWGFSCLVETKDKTLLFDTGADSETLLYNMEKLKIKPEDVDIIVLSHIHQDHIGGLSGFLEKNSNVIVYLPESFPANFKNDIKARKARVIEVNNATRIIEGVYSTGQLGTFIKEQSLLIATEKGLVIITGCAHPGIVNIIEKAKQLTNQDIYLVIGGFHLSSARDSKLREIINSFRKLEVEKVAPCHCSGNRCRELFEQEYKDNFVSNGVGKIIEI